MRNLLEKKIHLSVNFYERNVFEIIEYLKDYILNNDCCYLSIDISKLNLIDASKVSILCSTFHFSKYPEGEVIWHVRDKETQKTIKLLKLKNIRTEIKQNTINMTSECDNYYKTEQTLVKI